MSVNTTKNIISQIKKVKQEEKDVQKKRDAAENDWVKIVEKLDSLEEELKLLNRKHLIDKAEKKHKVKSGSHGAFTLFKKFTRDSHISVKTSYGLDSFGMPIMRKKDFDKLPQDVKGLASCTESMPKGTVKVIFENA